MSPTSPTNFSGNTGKVLENLIFLELRRKTDFIWYYKTRGGYEVDFLMQDKGKNHLIQGNRSHSLAADRLLQGSNHSTYCQFQIYQEFLTGQKNFYRKKVVNKSVMF
ncbi:MAG: DUF4143 domain-containing protein [Thermodesulfobacteriota bacterium]|nr:DUF4143 domain-containing protein [Thermodesulfobacteriota bacterium]